MFLDYFANELNNYKNPLVRWLNISGRPRINSLNSSVLDKWVFENFLSADELFVKSIRIFETCVLVFNNLCGKLVSSLEFLVDLMKEL